MQAACILAEKKQQAANKQYQANLEDVFYAKLVKYQSACEYNNTLRIRSYCCSCYNDFNCFFLWKGDEDLFRKDFNKNGQKGFN